MQSDKTVHTSIEVSKLETMLFEKLNNIWVVPISATTRPLDGNSNTEWNSEACNFFKSFPQLPELIPVFLDLLDRRATTVHVDVGP